MPGVAHPPDLCAAGRMTAGRQPFPVRTDGDSSAILQGPDLELTLGRQEVCYSMVGQTMFVLLIA